VYRVRLLFDIKGWAYHRRCQGLEKYAPDDFEVTIGPDYGRAFKRARHDLTLQLCYACTKNVREHIDRAAYGTLVVSGINVAWGSAKAWLKSNQKYAHFVLFNSEKAWQTGNRPPGTGFISNGIDLETFRPVVPIESRKPTVLSIGSKFHRKNKGFNDILPQLKERLKAKGFAVDFRCVDSHARDRMTVQQMAEWYQSGTVYLVASQSEGTPNPALEAAACGSVLVSTDVGNMPELIRDGENGFLVERRVDDLFAACLKAQERYAEMAQAMQLAIAPWDWRVRGQKYYDLFRNLIASGGKDALGPREWLTLTKDAIGV